MQDLVAPKAAAKAAGLRYVTDTERGFSRVQKGRQLHIFNPQGREVSNESEIRRIRKLAIPPAWTDVWICPDPNGHLQATGRDARGRKQHRYHPRWREVRDETKYNRMLEFARVLPKIRQQTARDLRQKHLNQRKTLAAVVRILETGVIRIGNEEYARQNKSFGLTTMRDRHVRVERGAMHFQFRGKAGKFHNIRLDDPELARVVKDCQDLPGQELFQYIDEKGEQRKISSTDVNDYLREITGRAFTAKDFRTWAGTVLACVALRASAKPETKKNVLRAIEHVASRLGNTPSICRKCYIHPAVMEAYLDGTLLSMRKRKKRGVDADEALVIGLLKQRAMAPKISERSGLLKQLQASIKHRKKTPNARARS